MGKIISPAGELAFEMKSLMRKGTNIVIVGRMGVWDSEIYLSYGEVLRFFLGLGVLQIVIGLPVVLMRGLFGRKNRKNK
jgi:hypothetical protein